MAAARALTMTRGPVGLADTNSRRTRWPARSLARPYARPAASTSRSEVATHAGARKTLRKPGPAISSFATSGVAGKFFTIASAIWRGARFAALAEAMATLVA